MTRTNSSSCGGVWLREVDEEVEGTAVVLFHGSGEAEGGHGVGDGEVDGEELG